MEDPFDGLLNLEEEYFEQGYNEGLRDGKAQAHTAALVFGIEKGFEKYTPMVELRLKAESLASQHGTPLRNQKLPKPSASMKPKSSLRLEKHLEVLLALTDLSSLDLANSDEAVGDYEERLRRAQAKMKVLERIVGEEKEARNSVVKAEGENSMSSSGDIENPRLNLDALQKMMSSESHPT